MQWLKNIRLAPKLIGAFLIAALLTLAVGGVGLYNLSAANARAEAMYSNNLVAIKHLAEAQKELLLHARTLVRALAQIGSPEDQAGTLARVENYWEHEQQAWGLYMQSAATGEEKQLRDELIAQVPEYTRLTQLAIAKLRAGANADAAALIHGDVRTASKNIEAALDKLIVSNTDQAEALNKAGIAQAADTRAVTWLSIAAAMIFALFGGWLLTRSLTTSITGAIATARRIADNDLTRDVAIEGRDEIADLLVSFRDMQEKLRGTLKLMSGSSSQLAAASEELHVVTEDMSRSLNVQNDQLHMAATAVTEMSAAIDEVARSANATSDSSASADAMVRQGRQQVGETKTAIAELSQLVGNASAGVNALASQIDQVSSVLDVIGAIAEQTNLLALNAAIEAARAGEQGRGFSVVADEVRALAGRTQTSTREIAEIIGRVKTASQEAAAAMHVSNERAQLTRDLADSADGALEQIATAISRINEMNVTIASASEEQAQTAREVDRNLVAIKDFGTQNATGALQVNASSNELARIATDLNSMVGNFRV